jgi:TetR/AcrR family transcriptional repressor of lmrAB and yxaGH operons
MSDSTREKLLKTAARLFHLNGINATGISEIIKQSGVSRGSFYYFFPNGKQELAFEALKETCENQLKITEALLNEYDEPLKAFHNRLQYLVEEIDNRSGQKELSIALVALESWATNEQLRTYCRDTYSKMVEIYANKLVRCGIDRDTAVKIGTFYQTIIDGSLVLSVTARDTAPILNAQRLFNELLLKYVK